MATRKVKIEGGYLKFSSAHFITYKGNCERLHGHNYAVQVEIEGELGQDKLVFDFTELKQITREICRMLDHRFLLPLYNPHFQLTVTEHEWELLYGDRRYVFPRSDVAELPIDNSTSERLAEYICAELRRRLAECCDLSNLHSITVGVAETPMQMAFYQTSLRK
jgi:6-pyruvoyltetrahydropterin/6-carboxytetrahydropterin synthase